MSAAPRRPRPGDSRPEQNNDLALSERDQQQVLNGGGGDSRERSGSRRGRRRVASLRGGEKGRARQNQGQVGMSQSLVNTPTGSFRSNCGRTRRRSAPPGDTSSNIKSEADANNRNSQQ